MGNNIISSVPSLSCDRLFTTPCTAACQASLSITNYRSLLILMCIKLVIPSNHFILGHPLLLLPSIFASIRVFPMSQFFTSGGQNIGTSASVLLISIQYWFLLGLTGLILQSKGLNSLFWHHNSKALVLLCSALYMVQHAYMTTGKTIALTRRTSVGKVSAF